MDERLDWSDGNISEERVGLKSSDTYENDHKRGEMR